MDKHSSSHCAPRIAGAWTQIAGNPDVGAYTSSRQEPVDFAVWQAADGTWQLWSCIRNTACEGNTRLFYRWEGQSLEAENWRPMGIAMEADASLGETPGGLQAPHVILDEGVYRMFYGDWNRICLAESNDGKHFTRVLDERGQPGLFSGPYNNTRDAMTLKIGDTYYCYYTGGNPEKEPMCAVFCRTSNDLRNWSEAVIVCAGGSPAANPRGNCECPFVVAINGGYCLFRNQIYGAGALNTQYFSSDPLDFGVDDDSKIVGTLPVAAPEIVWDEGKCYIAALMPELNGIRIARLEWAAGGAA